MHDGNDIEIINIFYCISHYHSVATCDVLWFDSLCCQPGIVITLENVFYVIKFEFLLHIRQNEKVNLNLTIIIKNKRLYTLTNLID